MDDIDPDFIDFKCNLLGFEYENLGPDHMAFFWTSTNYYDEKERKLARQFVAFEILTKIVQKFSNKTLF